VVHVDVQFASTHTDWPTLRAASLRAEQAGFDAVWVFDHLAGVSLDGHTNLECFTWLGALAEATSSVELGVLVANSFNRQLGTLAVAAASVSADLRSPIPVRHRSGYLTEERMGGGATRCSSTSSVTASPTGTRASRSCSISPTRCGIRSAASEFATFPLPRRRHHRGSWGSTAWR
jgi:hypothetical protein